MSSICPNINEEDLANVNKNADKALKQMGSLQATVGKAVDYVKKVNGQKNTEKKAKNDKLKKLADKLMFAINTYDTAPEQLEDAERNYYVFRDGAGGYKNIMLKRYKASANKIKAKSIKSHNEFMRDLTALSDDYTAISIYTNRISDLLDYLTKENKKLKDKIDSARGKSATSNRKTWYEIQQSNKIDKYAVALRFIYFALLVGYIIFGGYIERQEYKKWGVWLIIALYITFPFVLYGLVVQIFQLAESIRDFYNKKGPKHVYVNLAEPAQS